MTLIYDSPEIQRRGGELKAEETQPRCVDPSQSAFNQHIALKSPSSSPIHTIVFNNILLPFTVPPVPQVRNPSLHRINSHGDSRPVREFQRVRHPARAPHEHAEN
jgi:hypothetical protein